MSDQLLHAYVDEAGQRTRSDKSSKHFVMSAVVIPAEHERSTAVSLAKLRIDLGRGPSDTLRWRNLKSHSQRLHAAKTLGIQVDLVVSTVVVCKDHLPTAALDEDQAYLYTFRLLLERLSWLARDHDRQLAYTLAHVVRFKLEKLRRYETALRALPDCQVAWDALDPKGGHIDQPRRVEQLQLADIAASACFAAFEPDKYGNTEVRYLQEMRTRLYRHGASPLTSYGLKLHPARARDAYPWVASL